MRLAAKRFIKDLKRTQKPKPPFVFSAAKANAHCTFIEGLHHVEGSWASSTIVLLPFQVFFIVQLFGFRNHEGGRRFSTALLACARKQAKSTLAAGILLSCLCIENEPGAQVLSAATTGDQARRVWAIAKAMVDRNIELREVFGLETFANSIVRYEIGAFFKPINAKASNQDGLNPSHTVMDEVHAQKTHDLINVLTSASGARSNPLWLYTTTEGYENAGPWAELRAFAQTILNDTTPADHFLAVLYMVDEEDGDFDEACWIKANPILEGNPMLLAKIREAALEAQAMPGKLSEFRIKRLNRRAVHASAEIDLTAWRKCNQRFTREDLVGLPCWGAFDFASTADINAWNLLWYWEKYDFWFASTRFWVPESAVRQRTERKSVNYAGWVNAGFLSQTPGNISDYDYIEAEIQADCERYAPKAVAYDRWNALSSATRLQAAGVPVIEFAQVPSRYSPAIRAFERAYTSGNFSHGDNPVLTWMAANLICRRDVNGNRAPDRKRVAEKIDGMVALLMCFGVADAPDDQGDREGFFHNPVRG